MMRPTTHMPCVRCHKYGREASGRSIHVATPDSPENTHRLQLREASKLAMGSRDQVAFRDRPFWIYVIGNRKIASSVPLL